MSRDAKHFLLILSFSLFSQAGCPGCESSEHGCCPDGFTPAEGAYNLGCGCAGSAHGCCPDGDSEAPDPDGEDVPEEERGGDFAGCGEVRVGAVRNQDFFQYYYIFLQIPGEACHQEKDQGTCRANYTVHWFFDKDYGGCSRYIYLHFYKKYLHIVGIGLALVS